MKKLFIPAMLLVVIASPAQSGQVAVSPSFCQRLAGELGMSPAKPTGPKPAWEMKTLKGLGTALFGGSSFVSMGLGPTADSIITDARQYVDACPSIPNGLVCTVTGPAEFQIGVKERMVKMTAAAGEHAEVRIVKTRIRCEDR